jgi:hypothetical protein
MLKQHLQIYAALVTFEYFLLKFRSLHFQCYDCKHVTVISVSIPLPEISNILLEFYLIKTVPICHDRD